MTDDEIITSLEKERQRLTDDVARLRAALELIRDKAVHPHWSQRIAHATLAGADLRDPETRRAVALGKWHAETPTPKRTT